MKFLFTFLTIASELLIIYFVDKLTIIVFITAGVYGLFIKATNKNNSAIRNQLAWGLLTGTLTAIMLLVLITLWLLLGFGYLK